MAICIAFLIGCEFLSASNNELQTAQESLEKYVIRMEFFGPSLGHLVVLILL